MKYLAIASLPIFLLFHFSLDDLCVARGDQSSLGEILDFFSSLFDTDNFQPLWQSESWSTFHAWLYILSSVVLFTASVVIPITLGYFSYRKKDHVLPFRSMVVLFIVFILNCALIFLVDAAIFWWPAYKFSAFLRMITAITGIATVIGFIRIAPRVIELKSPAVLEQIVEQRTTELQALNLALQGEVRQREATEQKLKQLYAEVEQKSMRLEKSNEELSLREREITEREEKIRQLNLNLEQTVEERTAQLNNINQELEAFTYSVSHDLRAPLRAIDGYAKILEEDYNPRLDAAGKRLITVITKNARYMGQLIDDLLEFSRTSRSELIRSNFHTQDEVKKIVTDLMVHETDRKIEFDIRTLFPCSGDVTMLRQVWVNLIANALKYSRKNPETKIEIASEKVSDGVQYYVKDNGVGFDIQYADKLFGVFQRLHRKDEFEGTGVGLALVKRILDRHHGRVWAEATVKKGATFYFVVPS